MVFCKIEYTNLSKEDKRNGLPILIFLSEKQDGTSNKIRQDHVQTVKRKRSGLKRFTQAKNSDDQDTLPQESGDQCQGKPRCSNM